ncbi:MAG: HAD family hydrolase [Acidobacteriota bacterium]
MNQLPLRAVAFDLYGTLLALDNPLLHREIPKLFDVPGRRWLNLVRHTLLRRSFPDTAAMATAIAKELGAPALAPRCEQLLRAEVASARLLPGVLATLQFLARRGFKLGLISNLSSAHTAPLEASGLADLLDASVLSCRDGVVKPEPEAYRLLCQRLELAPEQVLMVGDSLANDVRAPTALGMRAAGVGTASGDETLDGVAELGWRRLTGDSPLTPLLAPGMAIPSPGGPAVVTRLQPVGEDERGRYNLVCRVTAHLDADPARECTFFAKRYLDPASARLEALGHQLQNLCGVPACRAVVYGEEEPILLVSAAPGLPLSGPPDPATAFEIGRQFAFGYVFANADLRPRNMLLDATTSPPRLTTFDLEHLLLNLAVEVAQLPDPLDPHAIDALPREHLGNLVKRRVLSARTLPRARSEFFDVRQVPQEVTQAFGRGFFDQYELLRSRRRQLLELVREQVYTPPYLIAGTRAYRRALADIDLEDLEGRLAENPADILTLLLAPR